MSSSDKSFTQSYSVLSEAIQRIRTEENIVLWTLNRLLLHDAIQVSGGKSLLIILLQSFVST